MKNTTKCVSEVFILPFIKLPLPYNVCQNLKKIIATRIHVWVGERAQTMVITQSGHRVKANKIRMDKLILL